MGLSCSRMRRSFLRITIGTNTKISIHGTLSISKPVTDLLCGNLVEYGKLNSDGLVLSHVPEAKGSAYESVTGSRVAGHAMTCHPNIAEPRAYILRRRMKNTQICTLISPQSRPRCPRVLTGWTVRHSTRSRPAPTSRIGSSNEARANALQNRSVNLFGNRWALSATLMCCSPQRQLPRCGRNRRCCARRSSSWSSRPPR